ncbi:four-carbon acid sugar kinase family protein [Paracoccus sp. M683]|uniref:3-oxo-tetronate kinase n=1 Tax=Paracoccus sp. M683 TaxID=2594268 RepID=UPI00117F4144|nr:3-oxo-tetronate kinase [Paracoccus sp. M683]TRW99131.1 four-carbon acid sugar kinase family protein [Paracoccus sp. M683]
MLIGVIADDFTGGSDIANTLAKGVAPEGGLRTAQYPGVPQGSADPSVEAAVISLKSRSVPADRAVAMSLAALDWLLVQGCEQIVFKYCSTFDSTDQGNIGPVAEALARAMDARAVVVCPAFPGAGRTVYQGHLFVFDRLLNESGMQDHPLTPMTDPDLRRVLGRQSDAGIGLVPLSQVTAGASVIRAALDGIAAQGQGFAVVDAISDADLLEIGAALDGVSLLTGGSGIALGLPRNFIRAGRAQGGVQDFAPADGPAVILAGSCSGATRGQVRAHAAGHPTLAIDVPAVMEGRVTAADLVAFVEGHSGRAPLVYSSGTPDQVGAMQRRFGREQVADRLDALFAQTARDLVARGYRRIVVAGGETSGAVAQAVTATLGARDMRIGPEIDPGVPILGLGQADGAPVLLALKSGNFGAEDFFAKALRMMERRS